MKHLNNIKGLYAGCGKSFFVFIASICMLFLLPAVSLSTVNADKVTLQLKWTHQFQFAGYYAAVEKGFYAKKGLDVTIKEAGPGQDITKEVINGNINFAVGTTELVISRARGEPVVVLAVIFQHSPLALMSLRGGPINSIHDIAGKRLMIEPNSAELLAYFKHEGISSRGLTVLPHSSNINDFLSRKADAISVYTTDEPFALESRGLEYNIFSPRSAGIDFYGDNLFTSEHEIKDHPQRVRAFLEASLQGWNYALKHKEEMVGIIISKYKSAKSRDHLLFEAGQMEQLVLPSVVEMGYMYAGRWKHIQDTYKEVGMLTREFDPEDGFMYQGTGKVDMIKYYKIILLMFIILLIAVVILVYIYRLNAKIKESRERYLAVYETAPLAFIIWDRNRRIIDWNKKAEIIFGWTRDEVVGRDIMDFLVPLSASEEFGNILNNMINGTSSLTSINENITKMGNTILCEWYNSLLHDGNGHIVGVISLGLDITEKRHLEERLEYAANYDNLTGLPNRALLFDRLHQAILLAKRNGTKCAILFIDLDGFKMINDSYGHKAGDELLVHVSSCLSDGVRESDTVARVGGDEFILVFQNISQPDGAGLIAEKILNVISLPFYIGDKKVQVGASIGISIYPADSDNAEALVSMADQAMYNVKNSGKMGYRFYGSH